MFKVQKKNVFLKNKTKQTLVYSENSGGHLKQKTSFQKTLTITFVQRHENALLISFFCFFALPFPFYGNSLWILTVYSIFGLPIHMLWPSEMQFDCSGPFFWSYVQVQLWISISMMVSNRKPFLFVFCLIIFFPSPGGNR